MFSPKTMFTPKTMFSQKATFSPKTMVSSKFMFSPKKTKYSFSHRFFINTFFFTKQLLFGLKWIKMVQNSPNSQKWSNMVFLIINSMGWPIYQVQPGSCKYTLFLLQVFLFIVQWIDLGSKKPLQRAQFRIWLNELGS